MTAVTSLTARHASSSFLASTARLVRTLAALASIALFATGCATPVGVSRLDQQAANRKLEANVLSTGKPSAYSTQILERTALRKHFKKDPEAVLARLNSDFAKPGETHRLFALSELSFAHAEASSNQSYYLASAVYAYAFLFPKDPTQTPEPYDPRRQVALDLYNRGVALGLATADRSKVDLSDRELRLPFGSLSLGVNPAGFNYAGNKLTDFVSLSDFKVRGLRNTYHTAGIGATLSAGVEPTANGPASRWIPAHAKVPITAFVRFDAQQCGFCTPGFVVAMKAVLDANPQATPAEIEHGLHRGRESMLLWAWG